MKDLHKHLRDLQLEKEVIDLAGGAGGGYSRLAFGHIINAAVVTILPGYYEVLGRGLYVTQQTALAITGGTFDVPHWIFLRALRTNPATNSIVYQAAEPNAVSATYFEIPLRRVYLSNDRACIKPPIIHVGSCIVVGAAL